MAAFVELFGVGERRRLLTLGILTLEEVYWFVVSRYVQTYATLMVWQSGGSCDGGSVGVGAVLWLAGGAIRLIVGG